MKAILDPELCWRVLLTLGHFLWQGAAIALIAAVVAWTLRRASARARHGVWATALLVMTLCPVGTFAYFSAEVRTPVAIPQAPDPPTGRVPMPVARSLSQNDAGPAFPNRPDWKRFAPHAMTAYLLGVTLMLGRLVLALGEAARLRRASEPVTDPSLLEMIARRSRAMRLRTVPAVALCREVVVPTVIGMLRPMILLPVTFATGLSAWQVEFILVHELELGGCQASARTARSRRSSTCPATGTR